MRDREGEIWTERDNVCKKRDRERERNGQKERPRERENVCKRQIECERERLPDPSVSEWPLRSCLYFYQSRPGALGREGE